MSVPRRFPRPELFARLPEDWAVLEASAGTGKTWTLERLVVDLLLNGGLRLEQILVVTFGEKAAREMRERIRGTLRRMLHGDFEDAGDGEPCWTLDDTALARLDQARMGFDRASISTIHAFCQRLLAEHALLGGRPFQAELVQGEAVFRRAVRECIRHRWAVPGSCRDEALLQALTELGGEEGLANLLLQAHAESGRRYPEPADPQGCLRRLAEAYDRADLEQELLGVGVKRGRSCGSVLEGLDGLLAAAGDPLALASTARDLVKKTTDGWTAFLRLAEGRTRGGRAAAALQELADHLPTPEGRAVDWFLADAASRAREIKAEEALLDYDDMLGLTVEALRGEGGAALAEGLRGRYRAALIDEFQDTSPSQWEIFRTVFQVPGWKLVLIGDPKQAIYGFRGGDIHTYRAAQDALVGAAGPLRLGRNHRSTRAMVEAYNRILDPAADPPYFRGPVGYPQPVQPGREGLAWVDGSGRPLSPVQLLRVSADQLDGPVGRLRRRLARQLAVRVRRLLEAGPRLLDADAEEGRRDLRLRAGDIYALTTTKRESALLAEALREAGVPCAFYKREGVFATAEARDLLNLLRAVAEPWEPDLRAKAWLTPAFGVPLAQLGAGRDLPETHPLVERLRGWHALAGERRYADLFRELLDQGLLRRLLRTQADDKSAAVWLQLTDWALEELSARQTGLDAFLARFAALVEGRAALAGEDPDAHRVETDRSAVQILTMHKAKGLEAKVVLLFGGLGGRRRESLHQFFDGGRRFWIGRAPSPALAAKVVRERDEEAQRLLYVAITRAQAQLILPVFDGDLEGPYEVLNRRLRALLPADADTGFACEDLPVQDVAEPAAAEAPGLGASAVAIPDPPDLQPLARRARPLRTASFTSLSRELPEHDGPDPEAHPPAGDAPAPRPPGGAEVGSALHAILERVPLDSAASAVDLDAWMAHPEVDPALASALDASGLGEVHRRDLAQLAFRALTARYPLPGGALEGLAPLRRARRELEFLLPHPEGAGFLEGSIDLLFEWRNRTWFLDWKSNVLHPDYGEAACAKVLVEKYELQFRIYTMAACAFLGIEGEADYEARFGGGLYVFLRGLPDAGVTVRRPAWAELQSWRRQLRWDPEPVHGLP